MAPRFMPKPLTNAVARLSLTPWRATTETLTTSWSRSTPRSPFLNGSVTGTRSVMILPGMTPIACVEGPCPRATKSAGSTRRALTLPRPTGASEARAANSASSTTRPPVITIETAQCVEIVDHDEIGAPAGRDEAAVAQAEDARGRDRRGAVGGERRRAKPDRGADDEVEMALFRDVERIAVVGAEGDEGRIALGDDGS